MLTADRLNMMLCLMQRLLHLSLCAKHTLSHKCMYVFLPRIYTGYSCVAHAKHTIVKLICAENISLYFEIKHIRRYSDERLAKYLAINSSGSTNSASCLQMV